MPCSSLPHWYPQTCYVLILYPLSEWSQYQTHGFGWHLYTDSSHISTFSLCVLLTDVYIQLPTGSLQLKIHSHIRLKILKYIYQHHPSPMSSLLFFSHSKNGITAVQPPKPKNLVIFSTFFILLCIQLTWLPSAINMTSLILLKSTPSFSPPLPCYCLSTGFYQSFFRLLQQSPKLLLPKPVFPNAHVSIHTTVKFILLPGESFNCSHHSQNHGQLLLLPSQHPWLAHAT